MSPGPEFDPLLGRGVSKDDHAALRHRHAEQARTDMPDLGPIIHHRTRVQCESCPGKVARYGTTSDGARHYCRSCVSLICRQNGIVLPPSAPPC